MMIRFSSVFLSSLLWLAPDTPGAYKRSRQRLTAEIAQAQTKEEILVCIQEEELKIGY